MSDRTGEADRCPQCGAEIDDAHARLQAGGIERQGCRSCALQLIRRPGGRWEGVRG